MIEITLPGLKRLPTGPVPASVGFIEEPELQALKDAGDLEEVDGVWCWSPAALARALAK